MRVLITGATGFIGRQVVSKLVDDKSFEVIAASRSKDPNSDAHFVAVDFLMPGAAGLLIERTQPTHLLHLAWNATPGLFWNASDNLDWTAASIQLIRAFADHGGKRAIIAGTCAEYDWTSERGRFSEDAPIAPTTYYGSCKDILRRAAFVAGGHFNMSVAWARIFWLYGPGESSGRLVSDVAKALASGQVVHTTAGMQLRDFMHVDDVANALVAALKSDFIGPFNIGVGNAVRVRDLIGLLADAAGRRDLIQFGAKVQSSAEPARIEADPTVLNQSIGFRPSITLELGLKQTYAWWKDRAASH